jgi:hypothetical protein
MGIGDFWMSIAVAQNVATGTKQVGRRHRVLSIIGGVAIAALIGAGLFVVAALNS